MKPYINCKLGTDVIPYEVIKVVSERTLHVRAMKYEPTEKHSLNNQNWHIESDENNPVIVVRKRKGQDFFCAARRDGIRYDTERFFLSDTPCRYYDYSY